MELHHGIMASFVVYLFLRKTVLFVLFSVEKPRYVSDFLDAEATSCGSKLRRTPATLMKLGPRRAPGDARYTYMKYTYTVQYYIRQTNLVLAYQGLNRQSYIMETSLLDETSSLKV